MMNVYASTPSKPAADYSSWPASIRLDVGRVRGRSALLLNERRGPLQVQRPFKQANGSVHLYILHPPGGVVGGDSIDIKVSAREGSRALVTTPSATKFYRVDNGDLQQIQGCQLTSKQGAVLEWLPLETIVFRGASPGMTTDVHLEADGRFVGWEILALGRTASGEQFSHGTCQAHWHIYRDASLLHRENLIIDSQDQTFADAKWGLASATVAGTLFISNCPMDPSFDDHLARLRHQLSESSLPSTDGQLAQLELTQKGELLIARYLGHSTEACRAGLNAVRHSVLSQLGLSADDARIWST